MAICVASCNGASDIGPHKNTTNESQKIEDSVSRTDTGSITQLNNSKDDDKQNEYWLKKAEEALDEMRKLKREAIQIKTKYHLDEEPSDETIEHNNWRLKCCGYLGQIEFFYTVGEKQFEVKGYKEVINEANMSFKAMEDLKETLKTPPM